MKVTLELDMPVLGTISDEEIEDVLNTTTEQLVLQWRAILGVYKKDLKVPSVAFKSSKPKVAKTINAEAQAFCKQLIDFHLTHMPKDTNLAGQRKVLKELHALGHTADYLITLYKQSKEEYKSTTWFTVKYRLNKMDVKSEGFERKPMTEMEKQALIERAKINSKME